MLVANSSKYRFRRRRVGLTEMPEIAEILSRRVRCRRMGVMPFGAQVLRTLGRRRKPDSSMKTRWAPILAAFFLPPASARASTARWRLRCAPEHGEPVSDATSQDHVTHAPRDLDRNERRTSARS